MNHLHFTDWITLSDRTWGPGVGSPLRAITEAGKPTDRPDRQTERAQAGPETRHSEPGKPVRHEPRWTVVRQLMPADLFVRNPYPALHRSKIK